MSITWTTEEVREAFCTPMSTAEMMDPDAHLVKGEWFDIWHAAEIRREKEDAWDEGFVVGEVYETREHESPASYAPKDAGNPYREAAS